MSVEVEVAVSVRVKPQGAQAALDRSLRVEKIALGDADTPGGILAWQNPEGEDILVTGVTLYLATSLADPDGMDGIEVGTAPDATTSASNLNVGYGLDHDGDPYIGASNTAAVLPAGHFVTASVNSGTAAGIAGYLYIYWHPAA